MLGQILRGLLASGLAAPVVLVLATTPAAAVDVSTEAELQSNFSNGSVTELSLLNDIDLTCAGGGDLDRDSANPITVNGNGFTIRQTCAGERVMELVDADSGGAGALTVNDTTITGGDLNGQGAGIKYGNPGTGGPITVRRSTFFDNHSGGSSGGAILQVGGEPQAVVIDSTFTDNSGNGAGTLAEVDLIINSTITGNTTTVFGAAIGSDTDVTVVYSTITGNTSVAGEPANVAASEFAAFGSVIGDPIGTDVNCDVNTSTSAGFNYEVGADTCGFSAATNDVVDGSDPLLGVLAENGGPTRTRLPEPGSPLLDAIPAGDCGGGDALAGFAVTADQRGEPRPGADAPALCDIGAVEVQGIAPTPTPPAPLVLEPTFTG
jgi:hypothetical protein